MGEGGSFLFMFTITKQFDQRNNDKCQLAQIAKVQLELHKRHPSLRVGLRDFFIFKKCSLTRYTEVYLRAEPYNEVKRTFKHRKAVRVFVIATVVFALVCVLGYILFDNWRERQFEDGHIVTRLYEEVEGTPPPEPEGTRVY